MKHLQEIAKALGLYGLLSNWDEYADAPWLERFLQQEEAERARRSLERRIHEARLGRFKAMDKFDWSWPSKIDRVLVDELFTLGFLGDAANVVLVGPNGVGKTMLAQNLAYQALLAGHTALFTTASAMLNDLASQDGGLALGRALKRYATPRLLVIDEVGYLSYNNRHADLLFEVVTRRYEQRSTLLTTNRPFSEWNEVFPNAACVVTLIDRLVHRAEVVQVTGKSYRLKEAQERTTEREKKRRNKRKPGADGDENLPGEGDSQA
jgi:DNA replication protein DnaC